MPPFEALKRISDMEVEMTSAQKGKVHWALWPFWALWKLISGIVEFTGRIVAVVLGLVLMIVGVVVSLTIVGAVVGVPLAIVGLLLTFRGLF
jgi:hypothetical protein